VSSLLAALGERTVGVLESARAVTTLGSAAAWRMSFGLRGMPTVTRMVVARQIQFTGVQALGLVLFVALLTAGAVVVQGLSVLALVGGDQEAGPLLLTAVLRDLAPLLVGVLVATRSGTAIAAELAYLRATHEYETLEVMGIDPFEHLIIPRVIGVVMAVSCLTVLFQATVVGGSWVMLHCLRDQPPGLAEWLALAGRSLAQSPGALVAVLALKCLVGGVLIAAAAIEAGRHVEPLPTSVPRAAARGAVRGIVATLVWNALTSAGALLW